MAKNIFSLFQGYVPKPKRNVFDLSFNNNFTTKFGQLTPVLCKEVIPGDSIMIDTAAGLRLMPMAFPVQTPMKAYVHYFYVRNRALWNNWQDFITGTKKDLVPPYIAFGDGFGEYRKKEFFKVGGIADYFGVPNTLYSSESNSDTIVLNDSASQTVNFVSSNDYSIPINMSLKLPNFVEYNFIPYLSYRQHMKLRASTPSVTDETYFENMDTVFNAIVSSMNSRLVGTTADSTFKNLNPNILPNPYDGLDSINNGVQSGYDVRCCPFISLGKFERLPDSMSLTSDIEFSIPLNISASAASRISYRNFPIIFVYRNGNVIESVSYHRYNVQVEEISGSQCVVKFSVPYALLAFDSMELFTYMPSDLSGSSTLISNSTFELTSYMSDSYTYSVGLSSNVIGSYNISDLDTNPYVDSIKLSALPFRAYECIYNSYYRNMQNNPYILNGETEYNKFIPSKEGGADYNYYPLHFRNWEYDFLTSAVPSPQFGIAPLVGITMTGAATFADEDGNTYYAQAELDSDGTITGWSTHSSNMPAGTLRMLMDSVGTGISINDLRNVNSFQRFLENSLRVGLKYRDQIKGHFGVEVRYDELDMPEFIGGMSLDINVNQVTQTADVQDSQYPLAGFAGQGGAFGSSNHSVTKYCDEHGFIIGILSVVPVPVYSQLLPKFFLKNEQLDYFFPEFGHIGYQPILQKEVSPLQSFYTGGDLNKVFGYQRAWYDYIASTDEVHGQFRTTLRDFVMNRTFENEPLLNEDFLLVDPEQVNDVFLSTESGEYSPESDKILGQLYFKITKKSPIPKLGIPRLTD